MHGRRPSDIALAAATGAALSGLPSTLYTLARKEDVLDGARAAGAMLIGEDHGDVALLAAAAPVHLAISAGWAIALAAALPRDREVVLGAAGGLVIAALDLGLIAPRRFPTIRRLPQGRQWADHVAYGAAVGAVLALRRR